MIDYELKAHIKHKIAEAFSTGSSSPLPIPSNIVFAL